MKPPRLREQVAAVIVAKGRMNFDEIAAAFPNLSTETVRRAVHKATDDGLVELEQRGIGNTYGSLRPAIYCAPRPTQGRKPAKNAKVRVASVWDLADPRPLALPGQPGRQYTPLGDWNSEGI